MQNVRGSLVRMLSRACSCGGECASGILAGRSECVSERSLQEGGRAQGELLLPLLALPLILGWVGERESEGEREREMR